MKTATSKDWKTEPMPAKHTVIRFDQTYTKKDRQKIVKGIIPEQMEDKWFVCFNHGVLHFHRSWTGYCLYQVYFEDNDREFRATHAEVNRLREQYTETDDEVDRQMIPYLIDVLLLKKDTQFPSGTKNPEDILKIWSSVGKAVFDGKPAVDPLTDLIRIVPMQRFTGSPAQGHRPYAFYADAASLKGKSVAESYRMVKGMDLPEEIEIRNFCSPFGGVPHSDIETPLTNLRVKQKHIYFDEMPLEQMKSEKFVVLRVPRSEAMHNLDAFPATWRALAYIVSDAVRMKAKPLGWDIKPNDYASARIHAIFREIQANNAAGLLAENQSKYELGLSDLDQLPENDEELKFYHYLSKDSGFTNQIVELFGISNRCWHGCGYIGRPGQQICRFYLLRNDMTSGIKVSIKKGSDIIRC